MNAYFANIVVVEVVLLVVVVVVVIVVIPPNINLDTIWNEITSNGYDGAKCRLEVKAFGQGEAGNEFEPFCIGFVDGLSLSILLHAYVSILHEVVLEHGLDDGSWTEQVEVVQILVKFDAHRSELHTFC